MSPAPDPKPSLPATISQTNITEFLKRAKAGDEASLAALRKLVRQPGAIETLGGDLASVARERFLTAIAGDDVLTRESVAYKLELMRAELSGPNPTPVEVLLIDRILVCWLQVHHADLTAASATAAMSPAWAGFLANRQDGSHRRFVSAVKALATVRRLAMPVLLTQINVAAKQVVNAPPVPPDSEALEAGKPVRKRRRE